MVHRLTPSCKPTNHKHRFIFLLSLFTLLQLVCHAQDTVKKVQPVRFKKHGISGQLISEGVAAGDVNNDGYTDILAGHYWFEAPVWKSHLLHADTLNPIPGYSTTFLNYCMDVDHDGWQDLIRFDRPSAACLWYENPKGQGKLWTRHIIAASQGNETPAFVDVDGDGRKDIICNDPLKKQVVWLKSPVKKGDTLWQRFVISRDSVRGTYMYTHGLGWGDINKDGRNDVFIKEGWWEAPSDVKEENWKFHSANFGMDGANMFTLDADGDGDQDIISSSAHDYGLWWHEQQQNKGETTWTTHTISRLFSQSHSLALEDINSDGHLDLVSGKRYFAHNGKDPGAFEPAVLYWFEYKPGKTPQWIAHQIDNDSGVGTNIVVRDITGDTKIDIVISNKKGVFFFEQVRN